MDKTEILKMVINKLLYLPYKWGGENPIPFIGEDVSTDDPGYDCSGYVQELLKSVGLDPLHDQTSQALHDHFSIESIGEKNKIKFGTLLFFGRTPDRIRHVAMAVSGKFMTEAAGGGRTTRTLCDAVQQKAFIRIRAISRRTDLVGVYYPRELDK